MLRWSFAFLSSNLFACPLMTPIIIRLIFRSIHLIFTQCTEWHFYWKYWMYRTHFVVRGASVNRYMCSGDFKQTNHQILPYLTENRHFNLNVYIAFHCQNLSLSFSLCLSLSSHTSQNSFTLVTMRVCFIKLESLTTFMNYLIHV